MNALTTILVAIAVYSGICAGQQCGQPGLRMYDENMAKLLTLGTSYRDFPTNLGELKKWCNQSQEILKDLEKFKAKCLTNLSKQVTGVFLYSMKNTAMRQYCKNNKKKMAGLIEAGPCLNRNEAIIAKCYKKLIDAVMGTQYEPDKTKIPHMCCQYASFFECYEAKLTKAPGCNEKHVELSSDMVKSVAGGGVDMLCGDYTDSSDKCQSLGPTPKRRKGQPRWKSVSPPIIDLLASFPSV